MREIIVVWIFTRDNWFIKLGYIIRFHIEFILLYIVKFTQIFISFLHIHSWCLQIIQTQYLDLILALHLLMIIISNKSWAFNKSPANILILLIIFYLIGLTLIDKSYIEGVEFHLILDVW